MKRVTTTACFNVIGAAFREYAELRKAGRDYFKRSYDLSEFHLRLGHPTPFYRIKTKGGSLSEELITELRQRVHPVILIGQPSSYHNHLNIKILVYAEPSALVASDSIAKTKATIMGLIRDQISIRLLSPYEISSPVVGEQFFGRNVEIQTILSNPHRCYILYGARRIGKTSMLKQLEHLYNGEFFSPLFQFQGHGRAHFISCLGLRSFDDLFDGVLTKIAPSEYWRGKGFLRLPRGGQSYLVRMISIFRALAKSYNSDVILLLDEIDDLIDNPQRDAILQFLRQLSENGYRIIMTGCRAVWNEMQRIGGPLWNFAHPMYLAQFSKAESFAMIAKPLQHMGIRIEEGVIARIYLETGGIPNLMQHYCSVIVSHAAEHEFEIDQEVFSSIYGHPDFDYIVMSVYSQNVKRPLEQMIVNAMISRNARRFALGEVSQYIGQMGIGGVQSEDVKAAANYLTTLGLLQPIGQESYVFLAPIILRQLQRRNWEETLDRISNELKAGER